MDVSLWREFGRLGVCERGELVTRMRTLLGAGLSQETAAFFLDMTDWDLQAAVCCYLDTYAQPQSSQSSQSLQPLQPLPAPQPMQTLQTLPSRTNTMLLQMPPQQPDLFPSASIPQMGPFPFSMRLAEEDCNKKLHVRPNVPVKWSWRIMNNGEKSWPTGCLVVPFFHRTQTFLIETKPIGPINPGEEELVEANLVTPSELGIVVQAYYLCTPDGLIFGDVLKIMLVVENDNQILEESPSDINMDHNMC